MKYLQVVIPTTLRRPYVEHLHADIGHFGRTKTCLALARRTYFPGWRSLTGMLVRNCPTCNMCQWDKQKPRQATLKPMRKFRPMAIVHAGLVGPLPEGKNSRGQRGFQDILSVADSATRYLWFLHIRHKTAGCVADPLVDIRHAGHTTVVGRGVGPCDAGSCTTDVYPPVPASQSTDTAPVTATASSGSAAVAGGLCPISPSRPVRAQRCFARFPASVRTCRLISHCPVARAVYDVAGGDVDTAYRSRSECMVARRPAICHSIYAVSSLFAVCVEDHTTMANELVLHCAIEGDTPDEFDME